MANLLIVDDDPVIREVIAYSLRDSGLQLLQAESGAQALQIFRTEAVHAILTDREVSGRDAVDILKEVKRSQKNVPVIVMVDLGEKEADKLLDEGAFATLKKPFQIDDIKKIVKEAVPASVVRILEHSQTEKQKEFESKKRKRFILGTFLVLGLISGVFLWHFLKPLPSARAFPVPYDHVSGLTAGPGHVWACDWLTETIYHHLPDEPLKLSHEYRFEGLHLSDIAWDGQNLWSVSAWSKKLYRHAADSERSAEAETVLPFASPSGFCADIEGAFWIFDTKAGKIIKFRLKGGQIDIIMSGKIRAGKAVGLFADKKYVWLADGRSGLMHRYQKDHLEIFTLWALPPEIPRGKLSAMAGDGKFFWIGAEGSSKIYRIHPKQLIQIKPTSE